MGAESYVQWITTLFQIIIVPTVIYGVNVLREIRSQLTTLNGRMIKQEQWSDGHEKLDQERLDAVADRLETFREEFHRFGGTRERSRR